MPVRAGHPAIPVALLAVGLAVSGWAGARLLGREDLEVPLNPLGINRSPYGEVLAMAMQGPINTEFHVGMYGATPEEMALFEKKPEPGSLLIVKPDPEEEAAKHTRGPSGVIARMQALIEDMRVGHARRTNGLPASRTLKFYLRRKAEDKLRMAYRLDPSHYANYNSLHFFLAEGIGTRPELTPSAERLARQTIDYCLSRQDDPRPALTAAAACTNILHLMFTEMRHNDQAYTPEQMLEVVAKLDECIAAYHQLASQWDQSGQWQLISPQRVEECRTRISFISNIRKAAVKTIQRFQGSE